MPALISRRTTSPKRRRRSSASTASSRSSASSETSKSASRVTRKTPLSTTSMPGKSAWRFAAMTSSSGTNVSPSVADRDEAREHLLRAPSRARTCARRSAGRAPARRGDSDRFEMYGNGRPRPTASGVSTGKIWRRKRSASTSRLLARESRRATTMRMPCSASAGRRLVVEAARWRSHELDDPLAERVDHLRRRAAVGARVAEAGVDLVVQAGDADHEELVEVRREDRRELQPLEQRLVGSSASCSTRSLNDSHESSRLK